MKRDLAESGMPAPESITVLDHRQQNAAQQLLPRSAVFSSTGWSNVHLELYQQPRFSTAEHQHRLHAIALGLPDTAGLCAPGDRWLDGKRSPERRRAGDFAIIPAAVAHRCSWDTAAGFMVLALEPELLRQVGQDWVNPDRIELLPRFMTGSDALIQATVAALAAEVTAGGLGGHLLVDSLTTALVIHLLRHHCATQPKLSSYGGGLSAAKLAQVKDYIEAHLPQPMTLVELAAIAQVSPAYFARLFKQSEGITPHQYILKQRVERAQSLLRHSPLGLADIAARVGFCDQSHLARCFKRFVGATPSQFRQR
ncbi:AraC family transcriptional regulator [Nodosilinea nodulosa]|uniref:AraC family transcriptional regulator n=1 Tax=Nodosilinea nodulosa TaxID=416001 RepID=UPI000374DB67|nr:AraC family transcriptional regulator [Nodosilinea nodulosa]